MTFDSRVIKFWQGESTRGYFQVEGMSKFLAGGGGGGLLHPSSSENPFDMCEVQLTSNELGKATHITICMTSLFIRMQSRVGILYVGRITDPSVV